MATMVIKQHTENGYYVVLEAAKDNLLRVEVCPCYDNHLCGNPIQQRLYAMNDKKNAAATFNRYVRKYCKGM